MAHHSPAAFDRSAAVSLRGEVRRYDWKNPHVYILVEGVDEAGQAGDWLVEADPTPLMTRSGWSASTLAPGDVVTIQMWPDRDPQKRHGLLASLTKADGATLGLRSPPSTSVAAPAANDISGIWDALPHFSVPLVDQDVDPPRSFTDAGLSARATYDPGQNPMASCLTYPTPMLTVLPYLNEIEILDDRVLIKSEFNSAVRTIYMDGREHPAGPRTIQGHSIGRWEGTTLVVDTRLYADYRLAHGPGIPSGAQKHTVERFALRPGGTELDVEIFVEDPEFVVNPYTVRTTWVHAPERTPDPFACDPENARIFDAR